MEIEYDIGGWIKLSEKAKSNQKGILLGLRGNGFYNKRIHKVYSIADPMTGIVFYIGCTVRPLHIRFREHFRETGGHYKKAILIREILESGRSPRIKVLYYIKSKTNARIAEKYITNYISKYGHLEHDLSNVIGINNVSEKINLAR